MCCLEKGNRGEKFVTFRSHSTEHEKIVRPSIALDPAGYNYYLYSLTKLICWRIKEIFRFLHLTRFLKIASILFRCSLL